MAENPWCSALCLDLKKHPIDKYNHVVASFRDTESVVLPAPSAVGEMSLQRYQAPENKQAFAAVGHDDPAALRDLFVRSRSAHSRPFVISDTML